MDYTNFMERRRDRAIVSILSYKDRACNQYLPQEVSAELRKIILDELNEFCESALDVIEGSTNDLFVERLEAIHTLLKEQTEGG